MKTESHVAMKNNTTPAKRKRQAVRMHTEAIITCHLHTSSGDTCSVKGVMRNFCRNGSYIETTRPFRPGAIIFMRILRYPPATTDTPHGDQPRSVCLAEVKWQQAMAEGKNVYYAMGLRYQDSCI